MRRVELKASGPKFVRLGGVVLLIAASALIVTGLGCTAAPPAQSTASSPATQSVSSQVTTESIKAQTQASVAQRGTLAGQLKALDAELARERASESSKASADSAKARAKRARRGALAAKLKALDAQIEADVQRHNALLSSEATAKP